MKIASFGVNRREFLKVGAAAVACHSWIASAPRGTDAASTTAAREKQFTVSKDYLVLPIQNGGGNNQLKLLIDGHELYRYGLNLAPNAERTDWYAFFSIRRYKGRDAKVVVSNASDEGFALVRQSDAIPGEENFYKEPHRPQFHFSQKVGWNNDPNGMVYANGEWHFFFQHNPVALPWGNMTWGHAVSKDLLHWKQLPNALYPDKFGTMYSGSGTVDKNNTAGFKTGSQDVIILAYTSAGKFGYPPCPNTQGIAYSNDNGRTFTKYEGNPVVKNLYGGNERDPRVFWHEHTKKWVMVLYLSKDGRFAFLASDDLKEWEKQSEITGFHECPELFELSVDGDAKNTKWILFGADAKYVLGSFDGKQYIPEHGGKHQVHWGPYYASQTFNNTPDGRRIQIGHLRVESPGPYNQHFSFPHQLTLRTTADGIRLFAKPIEEIEQLHGKSVKAEAASLAAGKSLIVPVSSDLLDVRLSVELGNAQSVALDLPGRSVAYDAAAERLGPAPLKPVDGGITIQVLADRSVTEIIGNDGRVYICDGGKPAPNAKQVAVTARGGDAKKVSLEVYHMKSIWQKK